MTAILVGDTGFVGSNLLNQHNFSAAYHSSNIKDAFGTKPDLLVYAGVRAEMFLANQDPEADFEIIRDAMENVREIEPSRVVLISTVAVYPEPKFVDEDAVLRMESMTAYGRNRYQLEQWVQDHYPSLIVRLPAIYGKNLKKNFLYDYIHFIPALLKKEKYQELSQKEPRLLQFYSDCGNGFYRCRKLSYDETRELKNYFSTLNFSALNFTDSRSTYQFYPLSRLWGDILLALEHNIDRINLVTPPISSADLYHQLSGGLFDNKLTKPPFDYDLRTKHSNLFGRNDGYIMSREEELEYIRQFVKDELK